MQAFLIPIFLIQTAPIQASLVLASLPQAFVTKTLSIQALSAPVSLILVFPALVSLAQVLVTKISLIQIHSVLVPLAEKTFLAQIPIKQALLAQVEASPIQEFTAQVLPAVALLLVLIF